MSKKSDEEFVFGGFEPANTTPVPDVLFDELLTKLTGTELKILLYIIRRTWGFKKDADAISLSQFQKGIITKDGRVLDRGSGISDRKTILTTLSSLEAKGCIQIERSKTASGDNDTSIYRINFKEVVVNSNHPSTRGSGKNQPQVVGKTNHGSGKFQPRVVVNSNQQETVIQQTDSQETVIQEESLSAGESTTQLFAPDVAPSPTSQSSLSDFSEQDLVAEVHRRELQQLEQTTSHIAIATEKNIEPMATRRARSVEKSSKRDTEPLLPIMPLPDAPWSKETAVRIVEAKKGRAYSQTTRKQELAEAGKVLEMAIDGVAITREQFESAWDELASSSWWEEHGKPCMIKYLRRDDTIVGIIKKLKRKGKPSSSTQAAIVDIEAERERARINNELQIKNMKERQRKRAEALAQGVKNG